MTTENTVLFTLRTTRMLGINVSIPNVTVARQEQFRLPQLRNQSERPTDVGVNENLPFFIRNFDVVISCQSPFTANVVPKAVATATFLRLSISAISSSGSLTPKTRSLQ